MGIIEKIFSQNAHIQQLYKTADGQVFFTHNRAVLHDSENEPELIQRENVEINLEGVTEEELTGAEFEPEMLATKF